MTGNGVLEIHSDDPDVQVRVAQGGEVVALVDLQTGSEVRLRPGAYEIALNGDRNDVELESEAFELKRNGNVVVRVVRKPNARSPDRVQSLSGPKQQLKQLKQRKNGNTRLIM